MNPRDSRIDDYIGTSATFARPILKHLRKLIRAVDADIKETIKWGMPSFVWHDKLVCGMAAFKQHCALNIWRAREIVEDPESGAMGQFGRISSLDDLPTDKIIQSLIRKRIKAYEAGVAARPRSAKKPAPQVPPDLKAALTGNVRAQTTFKGFSNAQRREYIEWINEAKQDTTRQRRLATTLEWLAEGKQRNWKYQNGKKS